MPKLFEEWEVIPLGFLGVFHHVSPRCENRIEVVCISAHSSVFRLFGLNRSWR